MSKIQSKKGRHRWLFIDHNGRFFTLGMDAYFNEKEAFWLANALSNPCAFWCPIKPLIIEVPQ